MEYIALVLAAASAAAVWILYRGQKKMHDEYLEFLDSRQSELAAAINSLADIVARLKQANAEDLTAVSHDSDNADSDYHVANERLTGGYAASEQIIGSHAANEPISVSQTADMNENNPEAAGDNDFIVIARSKTALPSAVERNIKRLKAEQMLKQGVPVDKIAKELKIGTGEVQLISNFLAKSERLQQKR